MTLDADRRPDSVVDREDPGDLTARRFQYQYAHSATLCALLLDQTQGILEVYCEQHEDVLLKHADGLFTGVQVKTREHDQPIWKTYDEPMLSACVRFAKLEKAFPGQFRGFEIATNHPCHHEENGNSIPYQLGTLAGATDLASVAGVVKRFVRKVALHAGVDEAVAFEALRKTRLNENLPKLRDAGVRLESALASGWPNSDSLPSRALRRAAQELRRECADAAALLHLDSATCAYLGVPNSTAAELDRATIQAKRFDRARVLAAIASVADEPLLLAGDPSHVLVPGAASVNLLDIKLETGGLSDVLVMNARDLRDKAEFQGAQLIGKFGRDGVAKYDHLRTIAQNEAAMAFEETRANGDPFGRTMLARLEERLKARANGQQDLFSYSSEHLLGMAYSLTAECKVRWSERTPWKDE